MLKNLRNTKYGEIKLGKVIAITKDIKLSFSIKQDFTKNKAVFQSYHFEHPN